MKHLIYCWMTLMTALSAAACAKSFDMSDQRLSVGPEWGVVMGSILVQPVMLTKDRKDTTEMSYEFEIVQSPPGDPDGESAYADRYRIEAKAGEERTFVSRLRTGRYLLKRFAQERMTGTGGDLGLVFDCMAGEVRYIGRLRLEIPQRASRGKEYRFIVENARTETVAKTTGRHADLAQQAIDAPMRSRD